MEDTHPVDEAFALETEGLTMVYGSGHTEVVALREASMRVRRGEIAASSRRPNAPA